MLLQLGEPWEIQVTQKSWQAHVHPVHPSLIDATSVKLGFSANGVPQIWRVYCHFPNGSPELLKTRSNCGRCKLFPSKDRRFPLDLPVNLRVALKTGSTCDHKRSWNHVRIMIDR